jgi:hypothetical protein
MTECDVAVYDSGMPRQRLCGTLPRQVSHEAERLGELVDAINALLGTVALTRVGHTLSAH